MNRAKKSEKIKKKNVITYKFTKVKNLEEREQRELLADKTEYDFSGKYF